MSRVVVFGNAQWRERKWEYREYREYVYVRACLGVAERGSSLRSNINVFVFFDLRTECEHHFCGQFFCTLNDEYLCECEFSGLQPDVNHTFVLVCGRFTERFLHS